MFKLFSKAMYEDYLNELSPPAGSEEWIIGGKIRMLYMWQNMYGTAIRKFDPIAFNVGYQEWKLIEETK